MVNLEQRVPARGVSIPPNLSYAESSLLNSYMTTDPSEAYDCGTCNNCGSGDCGDCCSSSDD